jgi:Tol biopolymer transport system component
MTERSAHLPLAGDRAGPAQALARRQRRTALAAGTLVAAVVLAGGAVGTGWLDAGPAHLDRPAPVVTIPHGAGEVLDKRGDLVAVNPVSGDVRTVVDTAGLPPGAGDVTGAAWSHDRTWVAFRGSTRGQDGEIWVAEAGGAARQAAPDPGWSPWAWSPTRNRLVVVTGRHVTLIDPATQQETDLGTTAGAEDSEGYAVHALAWSPDGRRVAYDAGGSVYTVDAGSGEHTLLVREPTGTSRIFDLDWSPDGSHLAIWYDPPASTGTGPPEATALYVVALDGAAPRLVARGVSNGWPVWNPGQSVGSAWSPDGSRLAYTTLSGESLQLWTAPADGSSPALVTSHCCVAGGGAPVWSPDGLRIAFRAEPAGDTPAEYLVVDADSTGEPEPVEEVVARSWDGGWYFCHCYG